MFTKYTLKPWIASQHQNNKGREERIMCIKINGVRDWGGSSLGKSACSVSLSLIPRTSGKREPTLPNLCTHTLPHTHLYTNKHTLIIKCFKSKGIKYQIEFILQSSYNFMVFLVRLVFTETLKEHFMIRVRLMLR